MACDARPPLSTQAGLLRQTAQAGLGILWSRLASDILIVDHWKSVDIETDFQAAISPCKADILAPTASTASGPSSRCVAGVALSTRVRMARAAMRGSQFCLPLRAARAARM